MSQYFLSDEQLAKLDSVFDQCNAMIHVDDPLTGGDISCHTTAISARQLPLLLSDPDQFWATDYGIPLDRYRRWKAWRTGDSRCTALNSKGKPCGGYVPGAEADEFEPGISDRCKRHQISTLVEQAADPNCKQQVLDNLEGLLDQLALS
jgi:hypothetical protein